MGAWGSLLGGDRNVLKLPRGDGYTNYVNILKSSIVCFKQVNLTCYTSTRQI